MVAELGIWLLILKQTPTCLLQIVEINFLKSKMVESGPRSIS